MAKKRRRRTRGEGSVYQQKGRLSWLFLWCVVGVFRYQHGLHSRELGLAALTRIHGEIIQGRVGLPSAVKDVKTLDQHARPWLDARQNTHRAAYDDRNRWDNHLAPTLGKLKPDQVDVEVLKKFIATKAKTLSKATVNLLVRLLSSLYSDLVEDGKAKINPTRLLSKKTRAKSLKSGHDPKKTPYLGSLEDVQKVIAALAPFPSIATAYAIGALAGLRTGEIRALRWSDVDLKTGNILVQRQVERRRGKDPTSWSADGTQPTKDDDGRVVPIMGQLGSILAAAKLATGGKGLVCPPLRYHEGAHLSDRTMSSELSKVLKGLELEKDGLGWYEATRHTFASLYVKAGGTMEDLQRMMGHSTLLVTMRYAHLRPDHYSKAARGRFDTDTGPQANHKLTTAKPSASGRRPKPAKL